MCSHIALHVLLISPRFRFVITFDFKRWLTDVRVWQAAPAGDVVHHKEEHTSHTINAGVRAPDRVFMLVWEARQNVFPPLQNMSLLLVILIPTLNKLLRRSNAATLPKLCLIKILQEKINGQAIIEISVDIKIITKAVPGQLKDFFFIFINFNNGEMWAIKTKTCTFEFFFQSALFVLEYY